MNNNYHTQMDKPNNILNEIAANNQLLHNDLSRENPQIATNRNHDAMIQQLQLQNLQNFPGTPINKGNQLVQMQNPQMTQQMQQQILAQQQQQNQIYQQPQIPGLGQYPNPQYPSKVIQAPLQQLNDNDEIELSEPRVEIKQRAPQEIKNESKIQQVQQQQFQPQNQQADITQQPLKKMRRPPHFMPPHLLPPPPPPVKKSSSTMEYIIIPILLMITFIVLVHPKTSGMLEKYLPKMTSMKGYLIRGLLLAVIYVVIKFITGAVSGGKNKQ